MYSPFWTRYRNAKETTWARTSDKALENGAEKLNNQNKREITALIKTPDWCKGKDEFCTVTKAHARWGMGSGLNPESGSNTGECLGTGCSGINRATGRRNSSRR